MLTRGLHQEENQPCSALSLPRWVGTVSACPGWLQLQVQLCILSSLRFSLFFFPARAGNYHLPTELHSSFVKAGSMPSACIKHLWFICFSSDPCSSAWKKTWGVAKVAAGIIKAGVVLTQGFWTAASQSTESEWCGASSEALWNGRQTVWCHAVLTHPTRTGWSPQLSFKCPFIAGKA